MKMNAKDILVPAVSLFIICLVATALLAVVDSITKDTIAAQAVAAEAAARQSVIDAESFEEKDGYYEALGANGELVGYVFNCDGTSKGYGGVVSATVGIDLEGTVTGVVPGNLGNETPGLGQNATKPSWIKQFIGTTDTLTVVKNGAGENQINAITSATITSDAVTSAVNAAREKYNEIGGGK